MSLSSLRFVELIDFPEFRVISNSRQRSGLDVPQQLEFRTTNGEIHVPEGLAVRSTTKNGVVGSHNPDWALSATGVIASIAITTNRNNSPAGWPGDLRNPINRYKSFMAQIFGALLVGKAAFHSGIIPIQ